MRDLYKSLRDTHNKNKGLKKEELDFTYCTMLNDLLDKLKLYKWIVPLKISVLL